MITREELDNIATLSKLYIDEKERECIAEALTQMMDFASVVAQADVQEITGTDTQEATPMRQDVAGDSLSPRDVLCNTLNSNQGYFTVKKNG